MSHLSDYPVSDTGEAGGYDSSLRLFFPGIDFELPSYDKVLERIEVVYDSLHELPITFRVWRRAPLTDAGTADETVATVTPATQADEPGVFYGESSPAWGTGYYAPLRRFTARAEFVYMRGRSFDVGLLMASDLTPVTLVQMIFHWYPVGVEGRGEIVST